MICVMKSSLKIVWKTKITFLLSKILLFFLQQKYSLFSETYFFKIPKNLITSSVFLPRQILKKHRYASPKASYPALVKLIESLKMIMWLIVRCFSVSNLKMAKQAMEDATFYCYKMLYIPHPRLLRRENIVC